MTKWPVKFIEILSASPGDRLDIQRHKIACSLAEYDLEPDRAPDNAGWLTVSGMNNNGLPAVELAPTRVEFQNEAGEALSFYVEPTYEIGNGWLKFAVTEDEPPR